MRGLRAGSGAPAECRALPRAAAWLEGWFIDRRGGGSCAWTVQPWGWAVVVGVALLLALLVVLVVWFYRSRRVAESEAEAAGAAASSVAATAALKGHGEPGGPGGRKAGGSGCWGRPHVRSPDGAESGAGEGGDGPAGASARVRDGGGEHRPLLMCGDVPPDVSSQREMELNQWMGSLPADDAAFIQKHLRLTVREADLQNGPGPGRRVFQSGRKFKQVVPMGNAGPGAMPPAKAPALPPLSPRAAGGSNLRAPKAPLSPRSPTEPRAAAPGPRKPV